MGEFESREDVPRELYVFCLQSVLVYVISFETLEAEACADRDEFIVPKELCVNENPVRDQYGRRLDQRRIYFYGRWVVIMLLCSEELELFDSSVRLNKLLLAL